MTSKSELRTFLKQQRQEFVLNNNYITILGNPATQKLVNLTSHLKNVALYHATPGEPDIVPLGNDAGCQDVVTALPWLSPMIDKAQARSERIVFRRWSLGDPLEQTALRFFQPKDDAAIITPDLILTPLVGFDRALNRLGQGAGHYDRAFQTLPEAIRVGVAWSVQEVDQLPVDDWDIPLDAIITEKEWIVRAGGRIG